MEDKNATSANDAKRKWNREYQRRWRAAHPEQSRETIRKYIEKNRKKLNAKQREEHYKRAVGKWPRKWISVDEFLPEPQDKNDHEGDVLVYVPKRDGCNQHGFYLGKLRPVKADPEGKGNFFGLPTPGSEWTLWGWSYYEQPIPSHWARLPDAPREERYDY